jgi:hypothetical protein
MSISSNSRRPVAAYVSAALAGVMLAIGCSDGSAGALPETDASTAHTADAASEPEFVSLTLEIPTCGQFEDCWRSFGFAAPGLLQLADREGMEQFRLAAPEYNALVEIVLLPKFRAAMRHPEDWNCPEPGAMDPTLEVQWSDSTQSVTIAQDCFGSTEDPLDMYATLKMYLVQLKNEYLKCGASSLIPIPMDTTGELPVRALCFACFGQC